MMMEIREIALPEEKSALCERVLRALPDWFGNEEALVAYAGSSAKMPLYAAFVDDAAVGFVTVKAHNPFTAEVYVMGILPAYHRLGIGRALIARCEKVCRESGRRFLTVKTLDASAESEEYARTRMFYKAMGFCPLEVFPLLWDERNPCLFLAKYVGRDPVPTVDTVAC